METRQIKFKAKRLDNAKWVEGDLLHTETITFITWFENGFRKLKEVDPSTICQFTGLKDIKGVEIWEHDIVSYRKGEVIYEMGEFSLKIDAVTVPLSMFMKDVLGNVKSKTKTDLLVLCSKFDRKEDEK